MICVGLEKPGDNPVSKLIASFGSPRTYSHAAIWLEADLVCEAHIDFGVRIRSYRPDDRWDFWELPTTADEERAIRRFCEVTSGDGYDACGALATELPVVRPIPGRWFCSEHVVFGATRGGTILSSVPCRVKPNDLARILNDKSFPRISTPA